MRASRVPGVALRVSIHLNWSDALVLAPSMLPSSGGHVADSEVPDNRSSQVRDDARLTVRCAPQRVNTARGVLLLRQESPRWVGRFRARFLVAGSAHALGEAAPGDIRLERQHS